jgi:hypothetical protein
MKIAEFNQYGTQGLGSKVIGESSGENRHKIGDIPVLTQTRHKNLWKPKPNHLLRKLNTTPDPPIFTPKTNDFQKPIKLMSKGVRSRVRNHGQRRTHNHNENQNQLGSIVSTVGRMAI